MGSSLKTATHFVRGGNSWLYLGLTTEYIEVTTDKCVVVNVCVIASVNGLKGTREDISLLVLLHFFGHYIIYTSLTITYTSCTM